MLERINIKKFRQDNKKWQAQRKMWQNKKVQYIAKKGNTEGGCEIGTGPSAPTQLPLHAHTHTTKPPTHQHTENSSPKQCVLVSAQGQISIKIYCLCQNESEIN